MMPYKDTKFQVESRQGAGLVSKRNTNREKIAEIAEKITEKIAGKIAGKIAKNSNCEKIAKKSLEPCARDMLTTRAVHVRHADHWIGARATCGP